MKKILLLLKLNPIYSLIIINVKYVIIINVKIGYYY